MLEQLTIKNLYNHMDETIAKDIFERRISLQRYRIIMWRNLRYKEWDIDVPLFLI